MYPAARLAWAGWAVAMVFWALSVGLYALSGLPPIPGGSDGGVGELFVLGLRVSAFVCGSTVGALVAARQPKNPFGWLLGAAGAMAVFQVFANRYTGYVQVVGELPLLGDGVVVAWLAGMLTAATLALIPPTLLLLPSGRLPSPRWRWVVAFGVVCSALGVLIAAIGSGPLANTPWVSNPFEGTDFGGRLPSLTSAATLGCVLAILIAAASLPLRMRTAQGEERLQLGWIIFGACVFVVGFSLATLGPREWTPILRVAYLLSLAIFVATLGVALLKYRLYDIDLVISRTLVYGTLALCITAMYVAFVAAVGTLIGSRGEPGVGLSLAATALVAVAFQPLRERLQRLANRLVYGQRASPYEVLADFSRRMAGALSVDEVLPRLAEAAARGVGAQRGRARVYVGGAGDRAAAWPPEAVGAGYDRTVPVLHQSVLVGEIAVAKSPGEPLTAAEIALLADLAAQAGPMLSNVRMTEDLRASRTRIVAAQDAERRRIERNLHDGAQQHLVALAVNARLARELVRSEPAEAEGLLDDVRAQADRALATLRDLARGIYPPALTDHGLIAALEAHVSVTGSNVRLEADARTCRMRFSTQVETAVYFCCLEALQNAAKYAPTAAVRVGISAADQWLQFSVVDDGPGFDSARVRGGTGLQGMADRMAALGGTLDVSACEGVGTRVVGRVPSAIPAGLLDARVP